jgi:AcrR family transcriptional regulator
MDDSVRRPEEQSDERARVAVVGATRTRLAADGYQRLNLDAVAADAGVPRARLRRWWATRALLVADTLQQTVTPPSAAPSGNLPTDLAGVVSRTAALLADPVVADALAGLLADASVDAIAAERLEGLLGYWRAGDAAVLLSAAARGELLPGTDVGLLLDTLLATLLVRAVRDVRSTVGPDELGALVLAGCAGADAPPEPPDRPAPPERVPEPRRGGLFDQGEGLAPTANGGPNGAAHRLLPDQRPPSP